MSRRARVEAQREIEAQEELKKEEERQKAKYDRIFSAVVWSTFSNGIRIQDLMPVHYDIALEIIKEYYIPEEVLARNAEVKEDPVSMESYLERMLFNLKDKKSIIAFDESLAYRFFQAGFMVARSLDLKVVVGLFSDYETQKLATRFNMRILKEIFYTSWTDKQKRLIFCAPGPGNYSGALMAGLVPPPPEPDPPPPPTEEELEAQKKLTRAEKRAMKIKKKELAEKEAQKLNKKT
ncbi:unnamed protein product [Brassicogethes aeneus]|uniref:Uncharacterized protein n=1 Tax=Brassicogethes aeneus TaxID=1431903 RepID=A0A9P0BAQ4_BRAAE|nr:unnamed protein product [Brassicogethes aeneus]